MSSRLKRIASYGLLIAGLLVAAEGIAQVGYRLAYGSWWSPEALKRFATPAAAFDAATRRRSLIGGYVLHPYVGFARGGSGVQMRNQLGFFTADRSDPRTFGKDDFVVVLTGGSVAIQAGLFGRLGEKLEQRLGPVVLKGRRVRLAVIALGSFKQPQQLMALNYLLVLGIKIDAIVNLDGYNDISGPTRENAAEGVHPVYPTAWARFLRRRTGGADLVTAGEIAYLRGRERALLSAGQRPLYTYSAFAGFLQTSRMQSLAARLAALRKKVVAAKATTAEGAGPIYPGTVADRRREAVAYWRRSSILMQRIARANGIPYLHILQPNQYVENSKPLSEQEKACCFILGAADGFGRNIRDGYRALRAALPALRAAGVAVVDGTPLFATESRTVYRDACCHFNPLGTDLLASFVAARLADRLGGADSPAPAPKPRQTP